VLKNVRILDVFTGEILEPNDLAIADGLIVGWGDYKGREKVDLEGRIVVPGLIDGHVHLESSMVTPDQFARAVVPRGTAAVVADPHEIANVCGNEGLEYILQATENLPLRVYISVPSCVPATDMEDNGATLDSRDIARWIPHSRVVGLGEVMDVPAVLRGDSDMLAKLEITRNAGKVIDGHAPGLTGKGLMRYRAFGVGSDHECTLAAEAREKLQIGLRVMLREGTAARNLLDLLPAVSPENLRYWMLVTDDRHPGDLLEEGHLDHLVRLAVKSGFDAVSAIRMATINTAEYFGLKRIGAIAPGYRADLVVLDDLNSFSVARVYCNGKLAAKEGKPLFEVQTPSLEAVFNTCNVAPLKEKDFRIFAAGDEARVIELVPGQIITRKVIRKVKRINGEFVASPEQDIAKLAVIERHCATGKIGRGLVQGFGLKRGALASTVAHDAHNLVVLGMDSRDMLVAAKVVVEMAGGLALALDGKLLGTLPLEIAGLMSTLSLEEVRSRLFDLEARARELGVRECFDPFLTMAFLSLAVISELKVTNRGLIDVSAGEIVPVSL